VVSPHSFLLSARPRTRLRFLALLAAVPLALTACGASGDQVAGPTQSHTTAVPPVSASASASASASTPVDGGGHDCASGSAAVGYQQEEFAVPRLCARTGALLTVVVHPSGGGGPMVQPRSSDPRLAQVVSATTDRDGTARATIRAVNPGVVSILWGAGSATTFSLRLDVVA
jgi:hypothetical protein